MDWINLDDGLPTAETQVLLYCPKSDEPYVVGMLMAEPFNPEYPWHTADGPECSSSAFTHWMPLPPAP